MHVHRVNEVVTRSDEAQLHALSYLHVNHVGGGIRTSIDGEIIRQPALHEHGRIREPLTNQPFLQLDYVFKIGLRFVFLRTPRVNDEGPIKTETQLRVRMIVPVIEKSPALTSGEFLNSE